MVTNRSLLLITLLVGFSMVSVGRAENLTEDIQGIVAFIEREMEEVPIPGLALAIVRGDQVVFLRGWGVANPDGDLVKPHTPFILASVTKSFTALAIMQLVEAGKVHLDEPVQKYLPWFAVAATGASEKITVRHLLHHTSGLPERAGWQGDTSTDTSASALERRVRSLCNWKLTAPVGEKHEYCNANYAVLGTIVQSVSGKAYEEYIQENIFDPLRMDSSFTSKSEALRHGLATGYRYWFGHPVAIPDLPYRRGEIASGSLISSAKDLSHYLIAHLNQGRYENTQILSPEGMAELHRPDPSGIAKKYAMGLFLYKAGDVHVMWHSGSTTGYQSFMAFAPKLDLGFALLLNGRDMVLGHRMKEEVLGGAVLQRLFFRKEPDAPPGNPFLPLIVVLVLLPFFQVVGVIRTGLLFRRWRSRLKAIPQSRLRIFWHIGLPLLANLGVAGFGLILVPGLRGGTIWDIRVMLMVVPDFGLLSVGVGTFALIWGMLRTFVGIRLLVHSARRSKEVGFGTG